MKSLLRGRDSELNRLEIMTELLADHSTKATFKRARSELFRDYCAGSNGLLVSRTLVDGLSVAAQDIAMAPNEGVQAIKYFFFLTVGFRTSFVCVGGGGSLTQGT